MARKTWTGFVARDLMAATGVSDAQLAIRQLARGALTEAEVEAAPVDLDLVASFQGVRSIDLVEMSQAGRLIPDEGGYRIQLNASHPVPKRRFTIGHEIGHLLIPSYRRQPHHVEDIATGQFDASDASQEEEYLCDIAATELLLPDRLFRPYAQAAGCHLSAVLELATRFEASREATARRLIELDLWPCALVLWHQAYKKSEVPLSFQSTLGVEWDPPTPKLRVRYAVTSATFGYFIPTQLSVAHDGLLTRCFTEGGPVSGEEVLRIGKGGREVTFHVMAVARDFLSHVGPKREVLSLLLTAGEQPSPHDALPTLWHATAEAFD